MCIYTHVFINIGKALTLRNMAIVQNAFLYIAETIVLERNEFSKSSIAIK